MKIVKISDMTDKEKEKWQKQVEDRRIERERIKEEDTKRANQLFNEEYEKRKKQEEENNRLPTARKNNILTDIKGIGSNFSRSIGNLAINAYKNIIRVNNNLITDRQKMLDENQNKLLAKVMKNKGYTDEQIENQINSLPTVESIANNSDALNKFTKTLNSVSEPLENKFQEWKDSNNKKIQENIENASNPISQKILELTPSMAQSSVNLIPGGNLLFTAGITQDYYDRAINERGLSEEEANKYASVMATLESATEIVGANLTKGVGKSLAKGNIKNALLDYGLDVGENFLEEAVMEPLEEFTVTKVAGEDKADWDNIVQRSWNAGIDGALTAILMGGASAGVGKAVNVVNKINNGQTVTKMEIREAVQDVKDSGKIDVEKEIKDNIQQRLQEAQEIINNANSQQQGGVGINDTRNINQTQQNMEQGYIQNENNILPVQNEENRYSNRLRQNAIDEINNSSISQNDKQQMLEVLNQTENVTEADIEAIKDTINEINKTEIENSKLDTNVNYKDSQDRRKKYMQYKKDNTSYDSTIVDEVLNTSPANRNGRRTVKQWLNVAKEIGTRIAEKSNAEIEEIAYKSWFNEEPSKSITQYDSQSHTRANFQKFTSDEWINKIYEGVNEAREQNNYSNGKNQDTFYDNQENNINQDNSQLNDMLNNKDSSMQSDSYEESAKKYNIDINNETVKAINTVTKQRKINARYDADLFNNSNVNAIWRTDTNANGNTVREIIINPNTNTNKTLQNIVIHELTHDFEGTNEYSELKELILSFDKTKANYQEARKSLENIYSKVYDKNSVEFSSLIENEVVADILGNKLGNQEFITELTIEKPSTARKIYNWIIDKLNKINKITGYKSERLYWEDVKNKFENAYKQDYKGNRNNLKYSIQMDNNGNYYVNIDIDQSLFKGKNQQEQIRIAKAYILNNFREKGLIKDNENINITRKTANEYTHPRNSLTNEQYSAKIKASTELDNLLEISKYVKSVSDDGRHIFAKNGWDYYETTFKVGDKVYTGLLNIAKGDKGKLLYDITNIKERASNYSVKTVSVTNSLSNNSIASSNENVNTNKYSIQESENNSDSFSMDNKDSVWQDYLDKNYKSLKSGESINQVKLPIDNLHNSKEGIKALTAQRQQAPTRKYNMASTSIWTEQQSKKLEEKNYFEKYNENKKKFLKRREEEINNLISYRNKTIRNIENKIAEKEKILNSKRNRDTKVASTIKSQIENLKSQKVKIENLYNERIDNINKKINKEKINYETRQAMRKIARENLKAEIAPLIEDTNGFKDKKNGFLYNRETAQRNIEDIVKNKELAKAINETIFDPVQKHQAEKTREINQLFKTINDLELDKTQKYNYLPEGESKIVKIDEATLAQLLIEKKITNTDLKSKYNLTDLQIKKINKTADTFSGILDYLYDKMNEEQIKYGYSPIGKIDNYFPHFVENKTDTTLGKIASYFGIDLSNQNLPTEIAGITDTFKPGKTWNGNTLQRKTNKTDYNALKAMERYIQGATDIIYTTEDIQKVRELEREIRYKYSEKAVQESIDEIINNKELSQEAKDMYLEGIFENNKNGLPNFTTWLNDYGNSLANKKAFSDRNMEHNIGRNMYSSMSGIEGRIASNTIGGNLSVSLTNFAPLFQSMGTTKPSYILTGMLQTVSNDIKGFIGKKDISFVDNSTFLTNRLGTDTIAKKIFSQKISDIASIPMNAIDSFTAESIVRAKYLENIDKGMAEEKALDNADKYAGRLMADRSKGAQPIMFNAKNPISKLVTMFQVEPNNIVSNYFKDMPRNSANKSQLMYQYAKLVGASYAFNTIVMAIRGGNEVLPDPVRWVSYLIKLITGDDDEKEKAKEDLSESIIGNIPLLSNLAGLFGIEDVGRVPISNAFPDLSIISKLSDKEVSAEYKKEQLIKEFIKPILYLGLPTGGAQIKKTIEGISTVIDGGSYKTDKNGNKLLQIPVENPNVSDYVKAGIFGKYSLPTSKEYAERGYKSLTVKQTKIYKEGNIPYNELIKYIDAGLKKNEDKIEYINQQKWTEKQKWAIYTNDIFSDTERKEGGSQLSDAEYITSQGVSKNKYIESYNKAQKNNIDMPTKEEYEEIKNMGLSLEKYVDYKSKITRLKKDSEKINVLINSNYSIKEKQALYENYIKDENDSKYDIIKSTGLNIDSYLQYKLAESNGEFKADTTDNGTVKGKTISGSAKEKRINYINSIKGATYTQKLILKSLVSEPKSKSDKEQVINYIKTLPNKTEKERLDLLSNFSWITIYKNGKIEY